MENDQLKKEFEDALDFLKYHHRNNREQLNKIRQIESRYEKGEFTIEDIKRFKDLGMKK